MADASLLDRSEINGAPATIEDLRAIATFNYGHFTSMRVREGSVRGLDLHLARLDRATRELFGHPLDPSRVRSYLRRIVDGERRALSVRVNVFSRAQQRDRLDLPSMPDVLVSSSAAREAGVCPLRVMSVRYEREAPHIKHVGTFGLFRQRRIAQAAGFDDAIFVDASGAISEGSIWNVGFLEGERVVWPDAPALQGISMQLLQAGLRDGGTESVTRRVELAQLGEFRGAFFTNSTSAVIPIAAIDAVAYAIDGGALERLRACAERTPWQPV